MRFRLVIAILTTVAAAAVAQQNPLDPVPPAAEQKKPANPLDPATPGEWNPGKAGADAPAPNLQKIFVPDFVKPGASFFYTTGTGQMNRNARADNNIPMNSGSVGVTRYDVLGVTESAVYVNAVLYLQRPGGLKYAGSTLRKFSQMEVVGETAFYTDMRVIDGLVPNNDLQITHADMPLNGKTYSTTTTERVTRDYSARQFWDRGTGLLLARQLASGQILGPDSFQRETTSSEQFISHRPAEMPWSKFAAPEWVGKARKLVYEGAETLHQSNGPAIPMGYRGTLEFAEHGNGFVVVNSTLETQWSQPIRSQDVASVHRFGNWWISPQALREMKSGVIANVPATKSQITYEVAAGPNGQQLGYLAEIGENNAFVIRYGYDLNDGCLIHYFKLDRELSRTTESRLVGRE